MRKHHVLDGLAEIVQALADAQLERRQTAVQRGVFGLGKF